MRVRARDLPTNAPAHEARYIQPAQMSVSEGQEYDVHALSVYDSVVFVLIVDDTQTATFKPRSIFDVVDASVPEDWLCNVFPTGPVQMVMGPEFIAKDLASYGAMVDQASKQQYELYKRIERVRQSDFIKAMARAMATTLSDHELLQILRMHKERGLSQQVAYDALASMRSSHSEYEDRVLEVMDIVAGYCSPSSRVWPEHLDT